ncbi:hypothetical protein RI543_003553 [Arxiozyma heterogenica]|uniref:Uncharacterized protein n=1 Tax=Arxiozyma heterogenica TaxID=278026 RepID=A0AAN7W2D8_9SACH|nr:hypothetical protein RI543_003553 [Kazachstania heterogenica]
MNTDFEYMPFSSTNGKIFNKQTQQLLMTSQRLLLNNLSFNIRQLVTSLPNLFNKAESLVNELSNPF